MLAQNFMTSTALGITDAEFEALVKVMGMLERGEIKYMPASWRDSPLHTDPIVPQFFNMALIVTENDCGTACCILGWARHIVGDRSLFRDGLSQSLNDLFRMGQTSDGYVGKFSEEMLPSEAAIALRNYLTTGEARWAEAVETA